MEGCVWGGWGGGGGGQSLRKLSCVRIVDKHVFCKDCRQPGVCKDSRQPGVQ